MRNKFTLILMATLIAITGIFATQTAEAAKRKVVVEDHTGAWCQYCPIGMVEFTKLDQQYGDDFIGVAVHNGDAMAVASYQGPLATEMGVTGYPNGTINRKIFANGKQAQHPNILQNNNTPWLTAVSSSINQQTPVGVSVEVDYDKLSGDYTATITAIVESDINAPLAFNLWALEDYMKGTGQQWDQINALSGQAAYAGTEFYSLPQRIVGYEHNDVFRGATGGLWGDTDGFPSGGTTPAGTYTKTYTGNVDDLNVENPLNAYFVAVVHNTTTKEILNADRVGKPNYTEESLAPTLNTAQTEIYKYVPDSESKTHKIAVSNNNSVESLHRLVLHSSSLIPNGWDVNTKDVTLAANASGEFEIEVNPNGNPGMATLVFRAFSQVPDSKNWTSQGNVFTLSATTERMYFESADRNSGISNQIIGFTNAFTGYGRSLISPAQLEALEPNLTSMFSTVIYTVDEGTTGLAAQVSAANLTTIKKMMANGTDVLLTAPADLQIVGNAIPQFPPTADATDFFTNTLGVTYGTTVNLRNGNSYVGMPITGVSGDPISNGMTTNVNFQGVYRGINAVPSMSLNGNSTASAFLEAPTTAPFNATNNKLGIRLDNNGQRTIFLSVPSDAINGSTQQTLVKNMIEWLEGEDTQTTGPKISLSTNSVSFGEVKVGEKVTKSESFTNTGDEKLIVTAVSLKNAQFFTVTSGTLPLTVDAGQTVNFTVEFSPAAEKSYSDELIIVSNDASNPNSSISLSGSGVLGTTSVPGVISDLFDMTVSPNPMVDNSEIRFNVTGSANVNIELIDATGRTVNSLYNGVTTGGTVELNASQLSSGNYYINANVDGKTTQMPVVITK